MSKLTYYVTAAAGPVVAGFPSPGEGREIPLTPSQAEQPLRLGYLTTVKPKLKESPAEMPHPLDHDGDGRKGGSKSRSRE